MAAYVERPCGGGDPLGYLDVPLIHTSYDWPKLASLKPRTFPSEPLVDELRKLLRHTAHDTPNTRYIGGVRDVAGDHLIDDEHVVACQAASSPHVTSVC